MGAYLIDRPGVLRQYSARSSWTPSRPTGLTVLHTTEFLSTWTVAQQAEWLRQRTTPGCYHDIADTYGADQQMVPYEHGAWQDATGSNGMALSISFVCRTTDWPRLTPEQRQRTLRAGARCFARQQAWLKAHGYPTTPLRMVTKAESDRGVAGFIYHGHRDPARRTDPGITTFPFTEFIAECRAVLAGDPMEDDVSWSEEIAHRHVKAPAKVVVIDALAVAQDSAVKLDRLLAGQAATNAALGKLAELVASGTAGLTAQQILDTIREAVVQVEVRVTGQQPAT